MLIPRHNPFVLAKHFWPQFTFYDREKEVIRSVQENEETYVPAANMMGKDFTAGFIALAAFLMIPPSKTVRIVSTSVKDDHLRVLWGEIGRFILSARYPLTVDKGGPLIFNHREIRRVIDGKIDKISYLVGMVSEKGEGMAGHHADYTLQIIDEASGVDEVVYTQGGTWAKKKLIFGNCNDCGPSHFFYKGIKDGDKRALENGHMFRKVIRIKAEDSPNVRLGLLQVAKGRRVTNEELVPGVLGYSEYLNRRATWDAKRQCVGLDADFYAGPEIKLFPPDWLNFSESLAVRLTGSRVAKAIGVDPAEGSDKTALAVIDERGLIELVSEKTPDTNKIPGRVLAFMNKHRVPANKVFFDRGGGGKQHVDRLRAMGYNVGTVAFGESVLLDLKRSKTLFPEKQEQRETHYTYKNRRAEMYHTLSQLVNPANGKGFALPRVYSELRRQLSAMPLWYDEEGRIFLPPKQRRPDAKDLTKITIDSLIGCSPDEADALVLAVYGLTHKTFQAHAGAVL